MDFTGRIIADANIRFVTDRLKRQHGNILNKHREEDGHGTIMGRKIYKRDGQTGV